MFGVEFDDADLTRIHPCLGSRWRTHDVESRVQLAVRVLNFGATECVS